MRIELFGYEFIFRQVPKGLRYVTEEELEERERRVNAELKAMRLRT